MKVLNRIFLTIVKRFKREIQVLDVLLSQTAPNHSLPYVCLSKPPSFNFRPIVGAACSMSNPSVLIALLSCALLWTFLFPTGEYPRVVKVGGRMLGQSERVAASVIGEWCPVLSSIDCEQCTLGLGEYSVVHFSAHKPCSV